MIIPLAIVAAYIIIGAFIAGWIQAEDATQAAIITVMYPLIPIMLFGAWLRELVHAVRHRREIPPAP